MTDTHTAQQVNEVFAPPPATSNVVHEQNDEPDEDTKSKNITIQDKRNSYMMDIRKLGRAYAEGVNSTFSLAEKLLEGTVNDAFTIARYPNGTVQDDALDMYKLFRQPTKDSKSVDVSSTDFNSNVGKYRNIIYLGIRHRDDAQEWFGNVKDIYEEKSQVQDIKKSMKPFRGTFEAVLDVVREQLERDGESAVPLMDDDEIFNTMLKKEKTVSDDAVTALIDAYKKLNIAHEGKSPKSGKGAFAGLKDQELQDIIQALQDYAFALDPESSTRFKADTNKKPRTRRVIKAPQAPGAAPATTSTTPTQDENGEGEQNDDHEALAEADNS